ncbi:MAG: sulfotransferase, partial [Bacteroidota bacterium]
MMNWRKKYGMETEPKGKPFSSPIFIIGCMRSGTTFLVDTLCRHPQLLRVGNELRSVWTEIGNAPCEGVDCAYRGREDLNSESITNMTSYFQKFVDDAKSMKRHLMRAKTKFKEGGGSIRYDWENIIPVNKSTHLLNKIEYLHAMFPRSKFIFIVRSMESQSASLKMHVLKDFENNKRYLYAPTDSKSSWSQLQKSEWLDSMINNRAFPENFCLIPEMWIRLNFLALQALSNIPKKQYHIVRYEQLVTNQETSLNRIFSFLELMDKYKLKSELISKSNLKVINTTTKGNPLEKWKKHLDQKEISQIAAAKESFAKEYDFILEK